MVSMTGTTVMLSAMKKGLAASFTINFSSDPKFIYSIYNNHDNSFKTCNAKSSERRSRSTAFFFIFPAGWSFRIHEADHTSLLALSSWK